MRAFRIILKCDVSVDDKEIWLFSENFAVRNIGFRSGRRYKVGAI
jgi:hypothetical protein